MHFAVPVLKCIFAASPCSAATRDEHALPADIRFQLRVANQLLFGGRVRFWFELSGFQAGIRGNFANRENVQLVRITQPRSHKNASASEQAKQIVTRELHSFEELAIRAELNVGVNADGREEL